MRFYSLVVKIVCLVNLLVGCYSTRQAYWQAKLLMGREPFDQARNISEEKKLLVSDLRHYAADIGLNVGGAYQHIVFPPDNTVSFIFSASEPLTLKPYQWWFPVVGRVPYKGFFSRQERDEEASVFQNEGYDVYKSSVAAFSSLGWFSDPIFPSMLNRPKYQIIELFLHELTHRTVWLDEGAELNENLAEFFSEKATKEYLSRNQETELLKKYDEYLEDKNLFRFWVSDLEKDLHLLYARKDMADKEKREEKQLVFAHHFSRKPKARQADFVGELKSWNNARVLAARVYLGHQDEIQKSFECRSGLRDFLANVKEKKSVKSGLLCSSSSSG